MKPDARQYSDYDLHGRSLAEVSRAARAELLETAGRWTAEYRNVPGDALPAGAPIVLCGHQPTMFHPGVWLKNVALGQFARQRGAAAINLLIDGDVCMTAALLVPTGTPAEPRLAEIAYDRSEPKIAHEERTIADRELFASFGRRAAETIAPLVKDPSIARYWPLVLKRAAESDNLGGCLAQARHLMESELWGDEHRTFEAPLGRLCRGEAFQWLIAHLSAQLPKFLPIYNQALREYRRLNRVRSRSHPAADLAAEPPWLEAPFWIWTAADPRRRRLFARPQGGEILLTDRGQWQCRLPLEAEGTADRAVERLVAMQTAAGVRIRPKALMTTLWARLFLGDLFIHGTGGAKYDWVTDRIIERFFRLRPPLYTVVTADVRLPIERPAVSNDALRAIDRELRELSYRPEHYLSDNAAAAAWIAEKSRIIAEPKTAQNARRRDADLRRLNAAMQPLLSASREELLLRRAELSRRLAAETILSRRDYAFCLHPTETLRELATHLQRL